jgi:sodium/bile acid cotransporter 7
MSTFHNSSSKSTVIETELDASIPINSHRPGNGQVSALDPKKSDSNRSEEQHHDDHPNGTNVRSQPSKFQRLISILKWFIIDQWFLIAMAIIILISSQVQVPEARQQTKRTVVTYLSVSVIFFINGCTFPTQVLIENYMRWKLHLFVQLQCYLVTSAAAFAIVSLCATNPNFSKYGANNTDYGK